MSVHTVAVVGGGIVGLAVARVLPAHLKSGAIVLEARDHVAAEQSGHNSGVVHSGAYYRPGSLKARLCVEGRTRLEAFCTERGLPYRRCGKLIVACRRDEIDRLRELERRGSANDVKGLRRLDASGIREFEPHVDGLEALLVPTAGVVDFPAVARAIADDLRRDGVEIRTGCRVTGVDRRDGGLILRTCTGRVDARFLVACAGLGADRFARACGLAPDVRILPFRGSYRRLRPPASDRVRALVYPVPDPRLPFLGVHLTRRIDSVVDVGPNAVPALDVAGHAERAPLREVLRRLSWNGTWRLAAAHWKTGVAEIARAGSDRGWARAAGALIPGIEPGDLAPSGHGIRAQAVDRRGRLVDDFRWVEGDRMLHVLNAPSPAATSSLRLGEEIARHVQNSPQQA